MKHTFVLIFIALGINLTQAQDLKAYQIYNKEKEKVSFLEMINVLSNYDVVLFGEYHDISILHWLQLKTTEALYQKKKEQLVLGAEMFERDNQKEVNQYLFGEIDIKQFKDTVRLWENFETDYRPLLDFAKAHDLKFVATNVPRRYARLVAHHGMDSLTKLPDKDKTYIAEFPIKVDMETPGYKEMKKLLEEHAGNKLMNFINAQAIKDATMAESILRNQRRRQLFLHFNGNYHSKDYGGIYWWLKKRKGWLEGLKVAVISIAKTENSKLPLPEEHAVVEYNIVIPGDMTKTH